MSSMADKLPSVLQGRGRQSSISMERALKQIKDLVECVDPADDMALNDRINASLDDLDMMIKNIDRG